MKEPLFHFILLGAVLFITYSFVSLPGSAGEERKIILTQGLIEHLVAGFAKTWQRPPTDDELAGLVRDRIREEVFYREALAMGLDKDDTVIRRRLWQKMEFISDDLAAQAKPTDDELYLFLQANPGLFRVEQQFTFCHVYINPEKHGKNLEGHIAQLHTQLNQAESKFDNTILGDPFLLENMFVSQPTKEVAKLFGEEFAEKLTTLPTGQWHGPVKSGYGLHLVLVIDRTEGRMPSLAEVRDAVHWEWSYVQRIKANEKFFQELLKRYTVIIEETLSDGKISVAESK